MAAKVLKFHREAREKVCAGLNILAERRQGDARSQGPHRDARAQLRAADGDQFGRHRREGDRARGPVREPGRADGAPGRREDVGDGRRRHDDGHGAGAGDRQRGHEVRRRRTRSDGHQAGHRCRRRGGRRRAREEFEAVQLAPGDRAGRNHLGERRRVDRRDDRRGDGEGRRQRRHQGRGRAGDDERARGGRGHAVRPRLSVAVFHHRSRAAARRA